MASQLYRVEVAAKSDRLDPAGHGTRADIADLGVGGVGKVRTVQIFLLESAGTAAAVSTLARRVLADPVSEIFAVGGPALPESGADLTVVDVFRKPGVMDPVAASLIKAGADQGFEITWAATGRKYLLHGKLSEADTERVCQKVLANATIEDVFVGGRREAHKPASPTYRFQVVTVPLREADDRELERISKQGQLYLNRAEMRAIQRHFRAARRDPTDVELETLAQTWSEHCVHKTLKGRINFDGRLIDNLLASTVARVTKELKKPWCVSVFVDNAGVIRFDNKHNLCFKVETHNHPSAIEPYGGAGTGIGGVIRDILGTGLGAKPILNTDVFCFGPPDYPHERLPRGTLHPKRIMKGVVAGVRDYGNRMGIPTANGAVLFDERYVGNCLVYCGTVGLIPHEMSFGAAKSGDLILVMGGATGRDGIHGATFSSGELTEDSEMVSAGAVQIGNAIEEKKVTDVLLAARDRGLYRAVTDCGAGGLSSAVGEMGEELGAEVDLEKVPLKYEGLTYTEIWISEAQERMVLAVPPAKAGKLLELAAAENVPATLIGRFTSDRRLRLRYQDRPVADLEMEFLHHGLPRLERRATWREPDHPEPDLADRPEKKDYGADLKAVLASWNACSKEWIVRQYDHEVQGASVLKPLVGAANDGPSDACVIAPLLGQKKGVIVANGINPKYGDVDPFQMAASAIDEALRQVVAVGGTVKKTALLDNFAWGNTDKADRLGALVLAAEGCYYAAKAYGTPFISGKDSLNNEYQAGGRTISIPHTLLISAVSVLDDVSRVVSMDLKEPGNAVFLVGRTARELGGSLYWARHGAIGRGAPRVDGKLGAKIFAGMERAIKAGLVRACHDLADGGLAVAAAEMAFAGAVGLELDLKAVPATAEVTRDDELLFSESNTRFLVEVPAKKAAAFKRALGKIPAARVGRTVRAQRLKVKGLKGRIVVNEQLAGLKQAWQKPLNW